jgi:putative heme-binding domain-containing protein
LFSAETAAMAKDLRVKVADAKAALAVRVDAAKKLISVDDSADAVRAILAQVDAQAGPELQKGLLDALVLSRVDDAGALIVKQWTALSPTAQRAALGLMTRKSAWTTALLDGIEKGTVNAKDLAAETWQTLTINPDAALAERAKKLQTASGRAPSPDKKKIIDGLAHLAEKKGDLAKGKEVYAKVCAVCHTLEGQGGKVGPDLTGIGARPKIELLSEILDPNRSVEGTYRQWTVETEEDTIYGRLLTESQTAVELIDATGVVHAIQRKDIKVISASERSIMPEGFDQALSVEEFTNLLEFLAHSNVKH